MAFATFASNTSALEEALGVFELVNEYKDIMDWGRAGGLRIAISGLPITDDANDRASSCESTLPEKESARAVERGP